MEPCFGHGPVALDRGRRDLQRLGRLAGIQPRKELQLDDSPEARVESAQLGERLVEGKEVDRCDLRRCHRRVQGDEVFRAASLARLFPARVIDQNLPHNSRGQRK
jgi:hypothetical protein